MENKNIKCKDCGNEFILTEGEQTFYAEKGWNNPVRCKSCRDKRKADNAIEKQPVVENKSENFEDMLQHFMNNTVKIEKD